MARTLNMSLECVSLLLSNTKGSYKSQLIILLSIDNLMFIKLKQMYFCIVILSNYMTTKLGYTFTKKSFSVLSKMAPIKNKH